MKIYFLKRYLYDKIKSSTKLSTVDLETVLRLDLKEFLTANSSFEKLLLNI